MGLLDWGMVRGQWAGDVSYALVSALTIEDRRAWERDLIARYLDRLVETGGPRLPFKEAWLAYRQQMFHPFFYWALTLGDARVHPGMQPDRISLMNLERMGHALVTWRASRRSQLSGPRTSGQRRPM